MKLADFIVIGAGIAGASAAAELSVFGSVCLLEAESQPGYHSTGRSAALFSEIYGNRVIRKLSRASRKQMFEPLPKFGAGPWTTRRGLLYVATSEQADQLLSQAEEGDIFDSVRYLTAEETQALCPVLRPGYAAVGLYESYASDIDVHGLHQAYLRQCRQNGGFLSTLQRVEEITRSGNFWEVRTSTASFTAPTIINAAGAWADQIALLAGVLPVGLQPMRRTALLVGAPIGSAINAWPLVVAADESFYFKPDAGRLLISPADETPMEPCDVQTDEWDIAVAIDRIGRATTIEVDRILHSWAGLRTFASDRTPVVGFDPSASGFFWLAGQGGYGVQTAPTLALVAAALACDRQIPQTIIDFGVDADELSPRRFRRTAGHARQ